VFNSEILFVIKTNQGELMSISLTNTSLRNGEISPTSTRIKIVSFDSIVTPTTVEQFRDNLKKYYFTLTNPETNRTGLVIRGHHEVYIDEISSLDDVYKKTKSGWNGSGKPFEFTPLCNISEKGMDYIQESFPAVIQATKDTMNDLERTTIVEVSSNEDLPKDLNEINFQLKWYKSDNQIWRTFFVKTLGEFSGYSSGYSL